MATEAIKRHSYRSYGSVAYDPAYAPEREGEGRVEPLIRPRERVVGRERVRVRAAGYVAPTAVLGFLAVAALAVMILMSYVQLTDSANQIVRLRREAETLADRVGVMNHGRLRAVGTAEELKAKLQASFPEADLSGDMAGWLKDPAADSAGSVGTVSVGGVTAKGTQVRSALGLRSACFTWEIQDGAMVFFVTGYGHGVGLSQYGANAMAEAGADYREILTHYYTGVTVEPYRN